MLNFTSAINYKSGINIYVEYPYNVDTEVRRSEDDENDP